MGRGALVFKGDQKSKSKPKSNKKKRKVKAEPPAIVKTVEYIESKTKLPTEHIAKREKESSKSNIPVIQKGTGKILSSGTVITGISTKFTTEFTTGDAIIIFRTENANTKQEMRVITMCLSDISCAISSPFSNDLKSPSSFSFINKPRNEIQEEQKRQQKEQEEWLETERTAFGTYTTNNAASSSSSNQDLKQGINNRKENVLIYRQKTETGSYIIKKEALNQNVTRDQLLEMRTKKKSDRYC